jgi:hypothetical protein
LNFHFPVKWLCALCQIEFSTNAWLRSISISWSVQSCVGNDCRNIMIPYGFRRGNVRNGTTGQRQTPTHLKVHLAELFAPPGEKRRTNVQVKLRKGIRAFRLSYRDKYIRHYFVVSTARTHQIGIPHPHGILHADLAHQQAVHPSKCKLHKFDALRSEVFRKRCINACDEFRHALNAALDTRLCGDVVVLDTVEQTRKTPERIGLDCVEDSGREDRGIDFFGISIWDFSRHCHVLISGLLVEPHTDICRQEHFEERCSEVVYPLHVSTGGMPYRPNIQYTLQTL